MFSSLRLPRSIVPTIVLIHPPTTTGTPTTTGVASAQKRTPKKKKTRRKNRAVKKLVLPSRTLKSEVISFVDDSASEEEPVPVETEATLSFVDESASKGVPVIELSDSEQDELAPIVESAKTAMYIASYVSKKSSNPWRQEASVRDEFAFSSEEENEVFGRTKPKAPPGGTSSRFIESSDTDEVFGRTKSKAPPGGTSSRFIESSDTDSDEEKQAASDGYLLKMKYKCGLSKMGAMERLISTLKKKLNVTRQALERGQSEWKRTRQALEKGQNDLKKTKKALEALLN